MEEKPAEHRDEVQDTQRMSARGTMAPAVKNTLMVNDPPRPAVEKAPERTPGKKSHDQNISRQKRHTRNLLETQFSPSFLAEPVFSKQRFCVIGKSGEIPYDTR